MATASASLLTCAGASVGVSISTQPRIPSRISVASKGLVIVSMSLLSAKLSIVIGSRRRASRNDGLFQICAALNQRRLALSLVGAFARRDLLNQFDDAAPKL